MPSRPFHRLDAHSGGNPDRRMWLLQRSRPRIHIAIVIMFALPAEGAGRGPRFDDEVMRFFKALPVEVRWGIMGDALSAAATHETRDQATVGDHVNHCQLLGQPERIIPD